jgi:phosphatidylglycerophosphate synthase
MQPAGLSVPFWLVTVVMCKEILLILGIVVMSSFAGSVDIKPTLWGKIAMLVQVLFIGWLFACYYFRWVPSKTFWSMVIVVMIVVSASLLHYMMLGVQQLWFKNMYVIKK